MIAPAAAPITPAVPAAPTTRDAPRRRSPGVLRTELRRGAGPWAGAALAILVGVTMYTKAPQWQGRWAETTDVLRVAGLLLGGPLSIASGCWQGGRERRRGTAELRATLPRPPLRQALVAAAPAALWPAAGYAVGATGCLVATWPYASYGHPFATLMSADAVAVAALGVVGFVVGRLIPWRLTAPLLAVVTYAVLGIPAYGNGGLNWLDPAYQHTGSWERPVWWFGPASALWTGGLAATVLLAYAARHRLTLLIPLALAFAAAVPIARTGGAVWRHDPAATRPVCDHGSPQVCVSAVYGKLLPRLTEALAGTNARLRGVTGAPTRWIEGPARKGPHDATLLDLSREVAHGDLLDPAGYVSASVVSLPAMYCGKQPEHTGTGPSDAVVARSMEIGEAVTLWLAPDPEYRLLPGGGSERELARLKAKSPAQGRAFLARYLAADKCDPEKVPTP
jgi:hypothetical protein